MYIYIKILLLIIISNVYCFEVNDDKIIYNNQYKECVDAIEKQCLLKLGITTDELNETCSIYTSKDCGSLLYNGVESISECQMLEEEKINALNYSYKLLRTTFGLLCIKDEEDEFCPYSISQLGNEENEVKSDEEYMKALEENCYSKKCTQKTILYLHEMQEIYKKFDELEFGEDKSKTSENSINQILDILHSENCTSKHANQYMANTNYKDSAFYSYKIFNNKILLIIVIILTIYLNK